MPIRQFIAIVALALPFAAFSGEGKTKREQPREGSLTAGDVAPDFTLSSPDGRNKVTLSAFKDKKPVVLVFGSYT